MTSSSGLRDTMVRIVRHQIEPSKMKSYEGYSTRNPYSNWVVEPDNSLKNLQEWGTSEPIAELISAWKRLGKQEAESGTNTSPVPIYDVLITYQRQGLS